MFLLCFDRYFFIMRGMRDFRVNKWLIVTPRNVYKKTILQERIWGFNLH